MPIQAHRSASTGNGAILFHSYISAPNVQVGFFRRSCRCGLLQIFFFTFRARGTRTNESESASLQCNIQSFIISIAADRLIRHSYCASFSAKVRCGAWKLCARTCVCVESLRFRGVIGRLCKVSLYFWVEFRYVLFIARPVCPRLSCAIHCFSIKKSVQTVPDARVLLTPTLICSLRTNTHPFQSKYQTTEKPVTPAFEWLILSGAGCLQLTNYRYLKRAQISQPQSTIRGNESIKFAGNGKCIFAESIGSNRSSRWCLDSCNCCKHSSNTNNSLSVQIR